jgi:hypothetical protein
MRVKTVLNIPIRELEDKIARQALKNGARIPKSIAMDIRKRSREAFENLKEEFENSSITQEIEMGPKSNNISNIVDEPFQNYGNLFSYIGFEDGSNPIAELRQTIEESFENRVNYKGYNQRNMKYSVSIPDKEIIFSPEKNPIPWAEGRSWVAGIERGISGFAKYLIHNDKTSINGSRSGVAIQTKNPIRSGSGFHNRTYVSEMIKNFIKNLKNKIRK